MTAFSPPADSWIIQYPKREMKNPTSKMRVPEEKQLDVHCRQYIESSEIPVKSNRSLGTDDHFRSMACSKNLLKVCEKVIGNRGGGCVSNTTDQIGYMKDYSKFNNRRGSQSLPPSPIVERKNLFQGSVANYNPYFTVSKTTEQRETGVGFLTSLFTGPATSVSKQDLDKLDVLPDPMMEAKLKQNSGINRKPTANEYREMNMFSPTSM